MNLILYNILNYLQNKDLLSFNIILNNYRYFEYDSNIIFYELKETLKYILKNRYNLKKRFNRFIEYQNLKKNFKNTIFDEDFIYEFPIYNYHGNFLVKLNEGFHHRSEFWFPVHNYLVQFVLKHEFSNSLTWFTLLTYRINTVLYLALILCTFR